MTKRERVIAAIKGEMPDGVPSGFSLHFPVNQAVGDEAVEAHEKDFDECRQDIKDIRANYLTRDDFIREMNKMDRKLDQMLELMMKK